MSWSNSVKDLIHTGVSQKAPGKVTNPPKCTTEVPLYPPLFLSFFLQTLFHLRALFRALKFVRTFNGSQQNPDEQTTIENVYDLDKYRTIQQPKFRIFFKQLNKNLAECAAILSREVLYVLERFSPDSWGVKIRVKGIVSPDYICLKVVWFVRPRLGHVTQNI